MTVRLYAMTCGWLTMSLGDMLEGETGMLKIPIPSYLIEHPKGKALFDTGLHPDLQVDPDKRLGQFAGMFTFDFPKGSELSGRLESLQVDPNSIDFVINSHLHFDHLGGVAPFHSIAMIDLPQTRADVAGGIFTPGRYEYLGLIDRRGPPSFRVTEWLKPGATIDLGGRKLTILSTPGHTPTSVALFDPAKNWLFIGDFLYPTTLYAFLPGASISAYQATAERLLRTLPADTIG